MSKIRPRPPATSQLARSSASPPRRLEERRQLRGHAGHAPAAFSNDAMERTARAGEAWSRFANGAGTSGAQPGRAAFDGAGAGLGQRWGGHYRRPEVTRIPPAPNDPAGRERFIREQLAQTGDLAALTARIPDDSLSFDILTNVLRHEYNVDLVYTSDAERFDHFSTRDLLHVARDLRTLPESVIQAYRAEGVRIRLSNGGLGADPVFRDTVGGQDSADGRPAAELDGTVYYHDPLGRSTVFISLQGLRNPTANLRGEALENPGGTASVLVHELAHGLDNIRGRDDQFFDVSSDPSFRALIDNPEVAAYWERINVDGSYHEQDPEGRYIEAFAELFTRYHVSTDSRARLPPVIQDFFATFTLQVT